jgi:hypothetical protein
MHARRQARNHVRSLERLGYQVTIQAPDLPAGPPPTVTAYRPLAATRARRR